MLKKSGVRKSTSVVEQGQGTMYRDIKEHKETSMGDKYAHYINGSNDFISVYIYQNLSIVYFKYVWFMYVNHTSIKLLKRD